MIEIKNTNEVKEIELNILKYLKEFCDENELRYYLCAGTLLGAVRHKGFIPWDDDIDVYMPRPDYEILLKKMNGHPYYRLMSYKNDGYFYNFAKVVDSRTILIEKGVKTIPDLGVYIDVFPLEGMPSVDSERLKRFKKLNRMREKIFDFEFYFPRIRKNVFMYFYRLFRFVCCNFRDLLDCQIKYNREALKYDYDKCEYTFVTGGRYKTRDIFPKSYLGDGINMSFENEEFIVPCEYDAILCQLYGKYMELPPEAKRISAHGFKAFYKTDKKKDSCIL